MVLKVSQYTARLNFGNSEEQKYKQGVKFSLCTKMSCKGVSLVSVHFKHGHKMEVCPKFHAPAALLPIEQDVIFEIIFSYKF
jgi:hypothetical protein